jgi:hypothetical protein
LRRSIFSICCLLALLVPSLAHAGVKEDYELDQKIYIAAGACLAAYDDRYGHLADKYLEWDGWRIDRYEKTGDSVDVRFLLMKKQSGNNKQSFVLAIVGTENAKDMKANLKVGKVLFAGSNPEEFAVNAEKSGVPATQPKVHRGFHDFVQNLLTMKTEDENGNFVYLTDSLIANPERRILVVGHSRGGAAATLIAARMISMGVKPEQIEVITFGAPAVGNDAFAANFEPVMKLTRVVTSGDVVTGVLQTLVGGYKQFGREILWESQGESPHELTEYVDHAIKTYFNARRDAIRAGVVKISSEQAPASSKGRVYIATLKNSLPKELYKEYWYMNEMLSDEYRHSIPEAIFANEYVDLLLKAAANRGCQWLIVPEVSGFRVKDERNVYYISLIQTVYKVDTGQVIKTASFSTSTNTLTPLEAFGHICIDMNYDWLLKK